MKQTPSATKWNPSTKNGKEPCLKPSNKKSRQILKNNDISESHEYSIRPGTQALPLINGVYQALLNIKGKIKISDNELFFEDNNINVLKDYLIKKFITNKNIKITGSINKRLPNHLSFILLNKDFIPIHSYKIVNFMSENNIAISSGSACSSETNKDNLILNKLNYDKNKLFSNVRVSFSYENNIKEVDKFYALLLKCIDIF